MRTEERSERPVGDLVQELSQQTATLVRQEMRLAQAELQEKGKHAGIGAGMFGGAGLVALYGVGALIAAAILLIGTAVEPWIAALITPKTRPWAAAAGRTSRQPYSDSSALGDSSSPAIRFQICLKIAPATTAPSTLKTSDMGV